MNATVKTVLIAAAVYVAFKVIDKLFLDEHVWSRVGHFEAE